MTAGVRDITHPAKRTDMRGRVRDLTHLFLASYVGTDANIPAMIF